MIFGIIGGTFGQFVRKSEDTLVINTYIGTQWCYLGVLEVTDEL